MLASAFAVGSAVFGGLGYLTKRSVASETERITEIANDPVIQMRETHEILRSLRESGQEPTIKVNLFGYAWAPRNALVTREDKEAGRPVHYALLRSEEKEIIEETNVIKETKQGPDGKTSEVVTQQRVQRENVLSSVTSGRMLGLIDASSFYRTGLTQDGQGEIDEAELQRRAAIRAKFNIIEVAQLINEDYQNKQEDDEHNRGFFLNAVPSVRDAIFGKRQTPEELLEPMFWADPADARPMDPIEKKAGGVWVEVPPHNVPANFFIPTMAVTQHAATANNGGGAAAAAPSTVVVVNTGSGSSSAAPAPAAPVAPRVVGLQKTEAGVPLGLPVFLRGTIALSDDGGMTLVHKEILVPQTPRDYMVQQVEAITSLDSLGNGLFAVAAGLAAGAVGKAGYDFYRSRFGGDQ